EAGRRESELALVELRPAGERRYRNLAEAIPHIVWTATADRHVHHVNRRWHEHTGGAGEQAARGWELTLHADARPACRARWQEALATGRMLEVECRLWNAVERAYRWQLCRAVPEEGAAGVVASWLGTFTDIEEQKRAQCELADFKATLDAVL